MPIALRALKTFSGRPGECGRDGLVHMGTDFLVATDVRANYLQRKGFATTLIKPRAKADPPPANKMEPKLQNKAADAGPLSSTGGQTGETSPAFSLSAPDRVQPPRASRKPKGEPE